MREIKVRAWDGEEFTYMSLDDNRGIWTCGSFKSYEQYTGLKDDSGSEWYEGDIVKCIDPEDDSTAQIVFKDAAFRKKYNEWDETLPYPIIDDLDLKWFRVIGNIHSNPELVKL